MIKSQTGSRIRQLIQITIIIVAITICLLPLTTTFHFKKEPKDRPSKTLQVIIGKKFTPPSFDPLNSDSLINSIHIEPVIGTLVRLSPSGRYETYLSEKWTISEDKKIWTFSLKKGLSCEDGTPLNAQTYVYGLHLILNLIKSHSPVPLFNLLIGYDDFYHAKNPSIKGLIAINETDIQFRFSRSPGSGLLEYLGLPFTGFYCHNNFDKNGNWKSPNKIISSSGYKIEKWDGLGPVTLSKRSDWIELNDGSPDSILIKSKAIEPIDFKRPSTLILIFNNTEDLPKNNLKKISLIPTVLRAISLSTSSTSIFKKKVSRNCFKQALVKARAENLPNFSSAEVVNSFYSGMIPTAKAECSYSFPKVTVRVLGPSSPGPYSKYLIEITTSALSKLNLHWQIIDRKDSNKNLMQDLRNDKFWDIKIVGVDIGGGIENQLLKYMFCSKLGISFPDPSGKICSLSSEIENSFDYTAISDVSRKYLSKFNSIIENDAAIYPILKSGLTWFASDDLKNSGISPIGMVPNFDAIEWVSK